MRQKREKEQIKKSEIKKIYKSWWILSRQNKKTQQVWSGRRSCLWVNNLHDALTAYRHGPASPRNGKTERLREIRRDSVELPAIREHPLAWSRHASTVHLHSLCDQSRTPHGFTELVSDLSSSPPLFLFPPSSPFQKCRRNCQDMQLHLSGVERRGAWAKY